MEVKDFGADTLKSTLMSFIVGKCKSAVTTMRIEPTEKYSLQSMQTPIVKMQLIAGNRSLFAAWYMIKRFVRKNRTPATFLRNLQEQYSNFTQIVRRQKSLHGFLLFAHRVRTISQHAALVGAAGMQSFGFFCCLCFLGCGLLHGHGGLLEFEDAFHILDKLHTWKRDAARRIHEISVLVNEGISKCKQEEHPFEECLPWKFSHQGLTSPASAKNLGEKGRPDVEERSWSFEYTIWQVACEELENENCFIQETWTWSDKDFISSKLKLTPEQPGQVSPKSMKLPLTTRSLRLWKQEDHRVVAPQWCFLLYNPHEFYSYSYILHKHP